jgi:hypothetical protein
MVDHVNEIRAAIQGIAAQIISNQIPALEGAGLIAGEAAKMDDPGELAEFGELARAGNEDAILERAGMLLADTA